MIHKALVARVATISLSCQDLTPLEFLFHTILPNKGHNMLTYRNEISSIHHLTHHEQSLTCFIDFFFTIFGLKFTNMTFFRFTTFTTSIVPTIFLQTTIPLRRRTERKRIKEKNNEQKRPLLLFLLPLLRKFFSLLLLTLHLIRCEEEGEEHDVMWMRDDVRSEDD